MRHLPRSWSLGLLACLFLSACGGDDEISLEDLGTEVTRSLCDKLETCVGPLYSVFIEPGTCETTFAREFDEAELPRIEAAIEAGTLVYHGDRAKNCIDSIRESECEDIAVTKIDECDDALEGKVEVDGDCNVDHECAGDAYCDFDAQCPGTCAARVGVGGPCEDDDDCEAELVCAGSGSCEHPPKEGQACGSLGAPDCVLGTICVSESEEDPRECHRIEDIAVGDVDDTCNPFEASLCDDGLSCAVDNATLLSIDWKCVAQSSSGGDCSAGFPDPCPAGEYCDADPLDEFRGTCEPLPTEGEDCYQLEIGGDPVFASRCAANHVCSTEGSRSVCTLVQRNGANCSTNEGCYSGFCDSGTCASATCEAEEEQ